MIDTRIQGHGARRGALLASISLLLGLGIGVFMVGAVAPAFAGPVSRATPLNVARVFTASATYAIPTGAKWIDVDAVGAGGAGYVGYCLDPSSDKFVPCQTGGGGGAVVEGSKQ